MATLLQTAEVTTIAPGSLVQMAYESFPRKMQARPNYDDFWLPRARPKERTQAVTAINSEGLVRVEGVGLYVVFVDDGFTEDDYGCDVLLRHVGYAYTSAPVLLTLVDSPDHSTWWEPWSLEVEEIPVNRVWTIIDENDGSPPFLLPGYRGVNRIGYAVSEEEWVDEEETWAIF